MDISLYGLTALTNTGFIRELTGPTEATADPSLGPLSRPRRYQLGASDPALTRLSGGLNKNLTDAYTNARARDSPPESYTPEPA
jgi:hypothetical protein